MSSNCDARAVDLSESFASCSVTSRSGVKIREKSSRSGWWGVEDVSSLGIQEN
jgi:hypothetical protein